MREVKFSGHRSDFVLLNRITVKTRERTHPYNRITVLVRYSNNGIILGIFVNDTSCLTLAINVFAVQFTNRKVTIMISTTCFLCEMC